MVTVTNLLNTNSPNSWIYALSYPSSYTQNSTGLITFSVSGNSSQPIFIFDSANFVNEQFGFLSGSTNTFASNSLISINVVNFINETIIYIHSNIVDNKGNDILQEIYGGNSQSLSTLPYLNPQIVENSKHFVTPENKVFHFSVTNEYGIPLNFNGHEIQITLLLYKRSQFEDMITESIKYFINQINNNLNQ